MGDAPTRIQNPPNRSLACDAGALVVASRRPQFLQAVYSGLVGVVHDELSTHPAGGKLVGKIRKA
jgi:hypothetical protein